MATIPAVPSFTFQEVPPDAVLNQLASCVTFVATLPAYAELQGGPTLTTATATALAWPVKVTDRDSGWSSGSNTRYTAQTGGYYDLSAGVVFTSNAAGYRAAWFQVTTGANNPGGAGNSTIFGYKGTSADPSGTTMISLGITSPYLYDLDYLQVFAFQNSGGNLATGTNQWELALISLGP
jgi:hypothetical protein